MSDANQLIKEARKIILANSFARTPNKGWLQRAADHLKKSTAKPVAAPDDATDWEGIAADQAMTIAMLRVDYQQLQALVTSQGVRMMEQEDWQKDAAKYRWLLRLFVYLGDSPAETLDAAIVKTMAKMPLEDV